MHDEKVMVRIPTHGPIDRGLASWLHWAGKAHPEWDVSYYYQTAGVCETRNEMVALFLESDADVLWMIDSDVTPPESDEILKVEGEVVAGLYGHYHPQIGANYQVYRQEAAEGEQPLRKGAYRFFKPEEWRPEKKGADEMETFRADAAGTGCMVVRRPVLERIRDEKKLWFVFDYVEGRRVGEDFTFCAKAGGVTVLPTYVCAHAREVNITELVPMTQLAALGAQYLQSQSRQAPVEENRMAVASEVSTIIEGVPPAPPPLDLNGPIIGNFGKNQGNRPNRSQNTRRRRQKGAKKR